MGGGAAKRYTFDRLGGPRTVVAVEAGAVLGFVTTRGDELAAINVDPSAWARGVGKSLIAEGRAEIAANGCAEAQLWMLVGNERAHRFYLRDGCSSDGILPLMRAMLPSRPWMYVDSLSCR